MKHRVGFNLEVTTEESGCVAITEVAYFGKDRSVLVDFEEIDELILALETAREELSPIVRKRFERQR